MKSIPIDIVNYICEFAAGDDKIWYPFFNPKTEKVTWKVNPYCLKYIKLSRKLLNEIIFASVSLHNVINFEERELLCRMIRFTNYETIMEKLYIEFDDDHKDNDNIFMMRIMVSVTFSNYIKNEMLYLNGTPYANINFGWTYLQDNGRRIIIMRYERY